MIDVSFCEDGVSMERERLFMGFGIRATDHPTPPALPIYPRGGGSSQPQNSRTGQRTRKRWRLEAVRVSETEQIWTHSNMNDFQHKNVCKTIDTNTRMCYYIDNTRTCYTTTTKQEDKNHEKDY